MNELHPFLKNKIPELAEIFKLADQNDTLSQQQRARLSGEVFKSLVPTLDQTPKINQMDFTYAAADGYQLKSRLYQNPHLDNPKKRLIILIHGGGMVKGSVSDYDKIAKKYTRLTRLPVLSLDYRLANTADANTIVEDVYAGVIWAKKHVADLGIDANEIALLGLSSGGCLSVSACLLARRRGLHIARQMLLYPMLDDATVTPHSGLVGKVAWTYAMNATSWQAYLGAQFRKADVSGILVPAHETNLQGLPPTYIDVGTCDIFCQEDIQFARRLKVAGVPVVFHQYAGLPHGFENYGEAPYLAAIYQHRNAFLRG